MLMKPDTPELKKMIQALAEDHPVKKEWSELNSYFEKLYRQQQGALSAKARTNIEYSIYRKLVEHPEAEITPGDFEYWSSDHDRVYRLLESGRDEKKST